MRSSRTRSGGLVACFTIAAALTGARYANGESVQGASTTAPVDPAPVQAVAPVPFGVGEAMLYKLSVKCCLWPIPLSGGGDASLEVEAIDTIRGFPTYRLALRMKGSIVKVFGVDNVDRSWLDVDGLFSRRFEQKHNETGHTRDRTYDFVPTTMRYERLGDPSDFGPLATPIPLDDISFVYFLRTVPLTATSPDMTLSRYYKAEGNPATLQVLRAERVKVPAGEFDAIVVRPIIRTDGFFGEEGEAQVWLSNDARRIVLKMTAKAKLRTTFTMELQSYTPGTPLAGTSGH